jgi:drug/metabolite transporter (DMT)-like permease
MSIPLSYLAVIAIWTTTPLAIKWSSQGAGFAFALTSRMMIGCLVALLFIAIVRWEMPWHKRALKLYAISGIGIFTAMMFVYWASQFIPSGWVSLIFGLSPILTGVIATLVYDENELTPGKLVGMALGTAGLATIFVSSLEFDIHAVYGILAVLVSTTVYSLTAIKTKHYNAGIPALSVVAGGLLLAMPLYGLAWYVFDGQYPHDIPLRAGAAIIYLALFGSVIGFALFFYILKHISATRVSLITLITPVSALMLGRYLNGEPMTTKIILGAGLIVTGLAAFELGPVFRRRVNPAPAGTGCDRPTSQ